MLKRMARECAAPEWLRPDDISPLMYRLLRLRGVNSEAEARAFLKPGREQLRDPFLLSDMSRAVSLIRSSMEADEPICVYGDYDVDGVCACAILTSYLKSQGANAETYLPSRHAEGYGLNEAAILKISEKCKLLVTVDCGITAVELTELAHEKGLKVVITDHHRPEGTLPDCPVVNPLLNNYPFPYLCGTGVAFQLVSALGGRDAAMEYIDYASLATIADIVPLKDENRALAALGLKKINASPRPGIRALIDAAGLGGKPLSAGNIAFQLTPRLNASGRLGDAMRAYRLITCENLDECLTLADELNEENARRKTLEQEAIDEAEKMLEDFDFPEHRAIVVAGDGWNPGVIGLASSRLTEKYHYPSVVLTRDGDILTGSCRSIEDVDIHDALTHVSEYLIQFGGHSMAAGLKLRCDQLEAFKAALDEYLFSAIPAEAWIPRMEYDAEVTPDILTPENVYELEALAPTGCGNPAPVFLMKCDIASARAVGANGLHLKLTMRSAGSSMDGIWFRRGDLADSLPREADCLFAASVNSFQGRVSVQAEMRAVEPKSADTRLDDAALQGQSLFQSFLTDRVYNEPEDDSPTRTLSPFALRDLMSAGVQGVLIETASSEDARRALKAIGSDICVDVTVGAYPEDARCFHTVAVCPVGTRPPGFKTVVSVGFPDGMSDASFRLDGVPVCRWFERLPDVDTLRSVYVAVRRVSRRPYFFANWIALVNGIAEEADAERVSATAGLLVLENMGLMSFDRNANGVRIRMAEMTKCNPEENALFQRFVLWREEAMEGESGNDE